MSDRQLQLLARLMDVSVLKAQIHADNLANQNTPGYKTRAVSFDVAFQAALGDDDEAAAGKLEPTIVEPHTTSVQADGNDVDVNAEVMDAAKNQTMYDAYNAMARGKLRLLNTAVTPAPGG